MQHRRGDDGNGRRARAQMQSHALRGQRGGDTVGGSQPENRASGEHHGVRPTDQIFGRQGVDFAPARSSAPHVHAGRPRRAAEQGGHPGADAVVGGVTHGESRDIGDQVAGARTKHAGLARLGRDDGQSLQHEIGDDFALRSHGAGDHARIAAGDE